MSRCFPFPPPGYERKHRPEDSDLLKKAEHKEKKQKKDKERRKNKEIDGSGDKHRDKKHQKGKHKDKKDKHKEKKDKEDQGKDNEKSNISEESTVAAKLAEESREKLDQKITSNDRRIISDEGKNNAHFHGKPFQNNFPSQETEESKFVQELDRRIRADRTGRGSPLPVGVAGLDKSSQETAARAAVRNRSGISTEEKVPCKDKVDSRKMNVHGFKNEVGKNAMDHNHTRMGKSKVEGISKPFEEHKDKKWGGKEVYKENGDDKSQYRHMDRDKRCHATEKDNEKEKVTVKIEKKNTDQDRPKNTGNNISVSFSSNKSSDLVMESKHIAFDDGNIQKRKDVAANGFLRESEVRPPKMPRPAHNNLMENGRKYEAYRIPTSSISDEDMVPTNVWLDKSEHLIHGIMEGQKPSPSKPNPFTETVLSDQRTRASKLPLHNSVRLNKAPMMENEITEASRRPPHPDSKHLSELLTIPKLVVSSENGDEDWLFGKKVPSDKLKFEPIVVEEFQVWSEAVHIKSNDVYALPYIVPH